jgi:hypothetical protein
MAGCTTRSAPDANLSVAGGHLVPKTFEGSPPEALTTTRCADWAAYGLRGKDMKICVIAWHVLWAAVRNHPLAGLDQRLRRWVFDDDGVRLSMKPQTDRKGKLRSYRVKTGHCRWHR